MLGLFIFTGCSNTSESDAEQVAKKFLTQCYNAESEKSDEIFSSEDNIILSHDKFKPNMTEEALNSLIANRMYLRNVQFSTENECSIRIQELDLNKISYDEKEKKIGYDYTATIEIIYAKDRSKEVGVEKGYIGLVVEENEWKVYSNKVTQFSDVRKKIN